MRTVRRALLTSLCLVAACTTQVGSPTHGTTTPTSPTTGPTGPGGAVGAATEDFDAFVESSFREIVLRQPELVTELGLDDAFGTRPSRLDDLSTSYLDRSDELVRDVLATLRGFDADSLSARQRITVSAYGWHLEQIVDQYEFRVEEWPVHFLLNSYNQGLVSLLTGVHPLGDDQDAEDYVARIDSVPDQVDQVIAWMVECESAGNIPPRYVIDATIAQLERDVAGGDAEATGIFRSFVERAAASGVDSHTPEVAGALERSFIPAWQALIEHLRSVRDLAGDEIGLAHRPGGPAYYTHLLSFHTSTTMSADEIHQLGWEEAARIKAEMRAAAEKAGIPSGTLDGIRSAAASSSGQVQGDEIVSTYQGIIDRAEVEFAPYFSKMPAAGLEVVNDPAPVAYYIGPAADGSRPGSFHAGTGGAGVSGYTMRSLAYHEAVPGHHFQISLAQELDLPSPLKYLTSTGHVEGWALYAERLASDVGVYDSDPLGDIGRLDFELLRAARLVVDTGIHHLGWSRQEAVEAMTTVMEGDRFVGEVDRYVLYPGQATAYLVGMNAILELREESGVDIGEPASLAAFHEKVIGNGNLPLSTLKTLFEGS